VILNEYYSESIPNWIHWIPCKRIPCYVQKDSSLEDSIDKVVTDSRLSESLVVNPKELNLDDGEDS
jgi:hypothetical protein